MADDKAGGFTISSMLVLAQGLTVVPKVIITIVIVLTSVVLCWILWQKPIEDKDIHERQTDGFKGQIGSSFSLEQTGGVNAGVYNNYQAPPATEFQNSPRCQA